jgi:signal transduction histidine kinase
LQEAYRSALHLLALINDVLDIAKIEAGKMQLEFQPCDLRACLRMWRPRPACRPAKGPTTELPPAQHLGSDLLLGDYQRLLQVMLNLVGNAIKFTPKAQ